MVVKGVVEGLFEEVEEGIGIASDVVDVKCEVMATCYQTPGSLEQVRWHFGDHDPCRGYVLLGPTLVKHRDHNDSLVGPGLMKKQDTL